MNGISSYTIIYIRSMLYSFRISLIFWPVLFSIASIALFVITSRIDGTLGQVTFDYPVLDWLLFAGGPDAARSILSTIAAGWATILGVVFSVTLITLQLSITKHTSEVIDEFENDKLNQLMLGWFISTVIYSLLVLKTVRTGEGEGVTLFAPVVGVNIAVFLAVVALFIFVSFLNNVSKYLKPSLLIDKIQSRVTNSLKAYSRRQVDSAASFIQIESNGQELLQIRSPRAGILRRIKLDEIPKQTIDLDGLRILIEFDVRMGEDVRKGSTVATVYAILGPSHESKVPAANLQKLEKSVNSALDIGQNRDLLSDPSYGIEILHNIAIKSINQSDINSIKSCVSGLFRILSQAFRIAEVQTNLLKITDSEDDRRHGAIVARLNEKPVLQTVLVELAIIYKACLSNEPALNTVLWQYSREYRLTGLDLLNANMKNQFGILTNWYAELLFSSISRDSNETLDDELRIPLKEFRHKLVDKYPYALDLFDVYMRRIFVS